MKISITTEELQKFLLLFHNYRQAIKDVYEPKAPSSFEDLFLLVCLCDAVNELERSVSALHDKKEKAPLLYNTHLLQASSAIVMYYTAICFNQFSFSISMEDYLSASLPSLRISEADLLRNVKEFYEKVSEPAMENIHHWMAIRGTLLSIVLFLWGISDHYKIPMKNLMRTGTGSNQD